MRRLPPPRLDHLRRLTDPRGLMHAALGDCPDRSAGYDSTENAVALELCARASDTADAEIFQHLAKTYYGYLERARCEGGRVHHACDMSGHWRDHRDDSLVQARLARALAAVMVSELPIRMRLSAAGWWSELLVQADNARTPAAVGQWLIALGQLRSADPGRDLHRAATMADWLVVDCYYALRASDWEWFEAAWTQGSAFAPLGLWYAHEMLGERRYEAVARTTTQFVIDHLFEDGLFLPVGTHGKWQRGATKPMFDQAPAEAASVAALLAGAARLAPSDVYGKYADYAAHWFTGNNMRGQALVDVETAGCCNMLRADGLDHNQSAAGILSYLMTQAALAECTITKQAVVYSVPIAG
jgi:hypothetical protein